MGAGHGGIEAAIFAGRNDGRQSGDRAAVSTRGIITPGAGLEAAQTMLKNAVMDVPFAGAVERFLRRGDPYLALRAGVVCGKRTTSASGSIRWRFCCILLWDMAAVVLSGMGVNVWIIEASVLRAGGCTRRDRRCGLETEPQARGNGAVARYAPPKRRHKSET